MPCAVCHDEYGCFHLVAGYNVCNECIKVVRAEIPAFFLNLNLHLDELRAIHGKGVKYPSLGGGIR
jgi:hypothetical protein